MEKEYVNKKDNPEFQAIYGITEFLRSYIDIYHDFLHHGTNIINSLKNTFETSILHQRYLKIVNESLKSTLNKFYTNWIQKIDSNIFTVNGRVIQPKCHQLIEELADAYIKLLHDEVGIKWMPTSKTNAFVGTYSLNNECDIAKLVAQLDADGVKEFYVESANSHIGKSLESHKIRVAMLDVGEWDAGSGYGSFKQRKVNTVIGTRKFEPNPRIINKVNKRSYEVLSAPSIRLFGFIDVSVGEDYHTLEIKNTTDNSNVIVKGDKDGYTRLSLNRVATTIKLPVIRGEGDAIPLITTPDSSKLTSGQKQSIASLKTWTDFIQIRTFSKLKSLPIAECPKMAMVINDKCCETSARMNGLSCVLKNEGSNITYYSYDINSRQMDKTILDMKRATLLQVLTNITKLHSYIGRWFDVRIHTMSTIKSLVPDPVLYFSSMLFSGIYQSQKETSLNEILKLKNKNINELNELIKEFPTTVSEWLQSITNSEGIYSDFVNEIGNLRTILNIAGSRQVKELIDYTDQLKQIIVNSLGKLITNEQQLSLLVSTTLAFIFFKKPRPEKYITSFESAIANMKSAAIANMKSAAIANMKKKAKGAHTVSDDEEKTDDKIKIMENASRILSELLETENILPIWKADPRNFTNNSNSQSSNSAYSKPIHSFTNIYLTSPKDTLSVLAHYQTYAKHNSGKIKEDFNYGFEGIYNRAMCRLLEGKYIPEHLFQSATCAKAGVSIGKRGVVNSTNINLTSSNNRNNINRSMKQSKPNPKKGGRQLKTRKRSRYNKQK